MPDEYDKDFFVNVRASELRKARQLLSSAKDKKSSYSGLLFNRGMLFLGIVLGDLLKVTGVEQALGIVFGPSGMGSAVLLVAAFCTWKKDRQLDGDWAERVLDLLVNPDDSKGTCE